MCSEELSGAAGSASFANGPALLPLKPERVPHHQGMGRAAGSVVGGKEILRENVATEAPAHAEIGKTVGDLIGRRVCREKRVFRLGSVAILVGEKRHVQIVILPDVEQRCADDKAP